MSLKEIHDDFIKSLGDESFFYSMVKKCAAEFRRGRESVKDYERSGHPKVATTDENVELIHSLIMCDRRRRLHDITRQISIRFGAVQCILTDILGMSKVSARWVPRMLTKDQRRAGLIFLSISCLSLKMTLRIYASSCDAGWDLGSSLWS